MIAVGADLFLRTDCEAAFAAGRWMRLAHRRATGDTVSFAHRVCGSTILAGHPAQPVGQLEGRTQTGHGPIDHSPDVITELNVFNILGKVIQAADQVEGAAQGR